MKKYPYCAEEIKKEAIKYRHCDSFLDQEENSETQSWLSIKVKKNSWYWKKNKVVCYIDGKFSGEIGIIEDLKCQVSNGKHKIHLEVFAFKQGVSWTKSNKIEIEMLNSNLTFDWGMNSLPGIRSEGLWIKQV